MNFERERVITSVRVRPLNNNEKVLVDNRLIVMDSSSGDEHSCNIIDPLYFKSDPSRVNMKTFARKFSYDYVFFSINNENSKFSSQEDVYNECGKPLVHSCMDGYNCCLIAYGQTGSGKTYTMLGNEANPGVIPRLCHDIFTEINKLTSSLHSTSPELHPTAKISASFYEIYNEKVYDLLSTSNDIACRVREHPYDGAYVDNLTYREITSFEKITEILTEGQNRRSTAATLMNASSSRSHAVYTIYIEQHLIEDHDSDGHHIMIHRKSKFNLVDLAGSERVSLTGVSGQQLVEANNINKSLSTLGDVIKALSSSPSKSNIISSKKENHVPYRNSTLTWLLKESLSGNSKTMILAAVSPVESSYQETMSTLKYIERVKSISTYTTKNDSTIDSPEVIMLKRQILDLKEQLMKANRENDDLRKENHDISQQLHTYQHEHQNQAIENMPPASSSHNNSMMIDSPSSHMIMSLSPSKSSHQNKKLTKGKRDIASILQALDSNILAVSSLNISHHHDDKDDISNSQIANDEQSFTLSTPKHDQCHTSYHDDHIVDSSSNQTSSPPIVTMTEVMIMKLQIDKLNAIIIDKSAMIDQYRGNMLTVMDAKNHILISIQRAILQLSELLTSQDGTRIEDVADTTHRIIHVLTSLLEDTITAADINTNDHHGGDKMVCIENNELTDHHNEDPYLIKELAMTKIMLAQRHTSYDQLQMQYMRSVRMICDLKVEISKMQSTVF